MVWNALLHGPFAATPMGAKAIPARMCTATDTERRGYQWQPCAGGGLRRQCGCPALHRAVRWRVGSPHRVAVVGQPRSQEAPPPLSMAPRTSWRSIGPRRGTGLYLCRLFLLRSEWPKRSPLRQSGGYTHVLLRKTGRLRRGFTSCSSSQHKASTLCSSEISWPVATRMAGLGRVRLFFLLLGRPPHRGFLLHGSSSRSSCASA